MSSGRAAGRLQPLCGTVLTTAIDGAAARIDENLDET